jgi:hypothetical protein
MCRNERAEEWSNRNTPNGSDKSIEGEQDMLRERKDALQ